MEPLVLALTGTPGTGKKTLAPILAGALDLEVLSLNSLAGKERLVDVGRLRSRLLKEDRSGALVVGHLVPDVLRAGEVGFVAVLRCEPSVLKKRLQARRYPERKLIADVEAELIGVVLDSAVQSFGEATVREYDSTHSSPSTLARTIASDCSRGVRQARAWTDWTLRYDSSTKLRSLLSAPRTEPAST